MALIVLLGLFAISPYIMVTEAISPGGNLLIGQLDPTTTKASFVDDVTGNEYDFLLIASEWDDSGEGKVTMQIEGPALTLCTSNGSPAYIDFENPDPVGEDIYENHYPGNSPLTDIQCGSAYGMAVEIHECKVDLQFHGYSHSDYPFITYMGMVTTDVKVEIGNEFGDNEIEIEVHTPRDKIKLKGNFSGNVEMEACQ
jgi:hypothetical protein